MISNELEHLVQTHNLTNWKYTAVVKQISHVKVSHAVWERIAVLWRGRWTDLTCQFASGAWMEATSLLLFDLAVNLTHYTLHLRPFHTQLLKRLSLVPSLCATAISLFPSNLDLALLVLIETSNMYVICLQVLTAWTPCNGPRATETFPYVSTFRRNCHLFSVAVMLSGRSCPIVPAAGRSSAHWCRVSCW